MTLERGVEGISKLAEFDAVVAELGRDDFPVNKDVNKVVNKVVNNVNKEQRGVNTCCSWIHFYQN